MAAKRSRTGCATCRKRKLKCDETKPTCGQCIKSRRECVPSDGVAFRHEQNPAMNSELDDGHRSLGNFYKYRNDFTVEQLKNFVPLPSSFEWRYITDVYADETDQTSPRNTSSPQTYQREVASHSLEALSTAAAENPSYQPPVTYADINNLYQVGNVGYGPVGGPNQNHNIKFLLNPSNTPAAMIDPNLDATALAAMRQTAEGNTTDIDGSKEEAQNKTEEGQQDVAANEEPVFLLKQFEGQPA